MMRAGRGHLGMSASNHSFAQVPQAQIPRSKFNRTHQLKTTFDAGYLVPVFVDEALPGDTFSVRMTNMIRLATPIAPLMDQIFLDVHFFAVPIRLIWENWERFNGAQTDPLDTTDYLTPIMTSPGGGYGEQTLHDYLGLPTKVAGINHVSLWHRAYNLIWNEWYRDQNLQNSVVVDRDDGPDTPGDYVLLKRGKRHDYFTSSLPWPQKGPSVLLPLGATAPIATDVALASTEPTVFATVDDDFHPLDSSFSNLRVAAGTGPEANQLYADLTNATAATINELRQAFQLQKLYERDARGGTRYIEIIKSHFGVTSPDARLQRPEFLGGGTQDVNITPVPQTSSSDTTTPQGNLAAIGTSSGKVGFTKSFTEHCVLLGLASARVPMTYQQGLPRMFSRRTRFDFYWPSLSHIGEQAVLNKEIYAQGTSDDEDVFGYQERYAEYRYKPSQITGRFRSNATQSLDLWHLAQEFSALPELNSAFIEENPPMERVLAVPDEPDFLFDAYVEMVCARPMPVYSVPGLIDHF